MSHRKRIFSVSVILLFFAASFSISRSRADTTPDWSEGVAIAAPRANPYGLAPDAFAAARLAGQRLALEYPVEISGSLIPWRPIRDFLTESSPSPLRFLLRGIFGNLLHVRKADDLFQRLGLQSFPETPQAYPFDIPALPEGSDPVRMGATLFSHGNAEVMTISCAACHASNLFGKKILGLSNRFPRANALFVLGKRATSVVSPALFSGAMHATPDETALYARLRDRVHAVGAKDPQALGLDTSLTQVALSLARRNADDDATFSAALERNPRTEPLQTAVADSKPAVWWNLKYKNRWLSDGSVVAGNPIYTNFLWNEITRGTDLGELRGWLDRNGEAIKNLTTAVFASEAPRYTDFFPADRIDVAAARRGQTTFIAKCARCHGTYEKAWDLPTATALSAVDPFRTTAVLYSPQTRVVDVGTDAGRRNGMASLERGLNPLAISRKNGILIRVSGGYVPPPLVGIWARWPYFHNNSVPTLCAVLLPAKERPVRFYSGDALDPNADFDDSCNGYPTGSATPKSWKTADHLYDTRREGLSNSGHETGVTAADRRDLIQFLKTL